MSRHPLVRRTHGVLLAGLLLVAAALVPSPVAAQTDSAAAGPRWQRIYAGDDVSIWIDSRTARYEDGSVLRVWTDWRYERVQTIDESGRLYDSVKVQDEVDCDRRQFRTVRANFYYRGRSLGLHEIPSPAWREPVPESMAESLVDGVCFWAGR